MIEQYRNKPIAHIEPLVIKRSTGRVITINAIGYGMVKPCIDIVKETTTVSGRSKIETVAFKDNEFDAVYTYLTKVKQHWEEE